ncbi:MAG: hypothetical protein MH204_11020, partial [Fimbriimonadaceae bacterium]|nr:hypothetical protein [Fimbriimonadaceae bacterium]
LKAAERVQPGFIIEAERQPTGRGWDVEILASSGRVVEVEVRGSRTKMEQAGRPEFRIDRRTTARQAAERALRKRPGRTNIQLVEQDREGSRTYWRIRLESGGKTESLRLRTDNLEPL